MWHLEDQQLISPKQAAFRQDRSTEDQVTYLAQAIEDAFQNKQHTIAIWIDLEKAFDKLSHDFIFSFYLNVTTLSPVLICIF